MKRKKLLAMVIACIVAFSSFTVSAGAHELGTSGGYRWYNLGNVISPTTGQTSKQAQVSISTTGGLGTIYDEAITHWNNNSGAKTKFTNVTSSARCVVNVATQSGWDSMRLPSNYIAAAYLYNSNSGGTCISSPNPLGLPAGFNSGTIQRAVIYIRPDFTKYATTTAHQHYLMRHEMGHVLGLGHTPSLSIPSIMYDIISNNNTLENHDRIDLAAFYP